MNLEQAKRLMPGNKVRDWVAEETGVVHAVGWQVDPDSGEHCVKVSVRFPADESCEEAYVRDYVDRQVEFLERV